jgi:hypothetical protein
MEIKIDNSSIQPLIDAQIKAAVAAALAQKSDYLISRIVEQALLAKDNYSRETFLDKRIKEAIQQETVAGLNAWLDEHREPIRKQVYAVLQKKKDGLVAMIVERMVAKLGKGFDVSVWFRNEGD